MIYIYKTKIALNDNIQYTKFLNLYYSGTNIVMSTRI